jgi:signal transduction histidine kinase
VSRQDRALLLRVCAVYAAFSLIWIFTSTPLLAALGLEPERFAHAEMVKGSAFVLVSTGIIFGLLSRELAARRAAEQAQHRLESQLAVAQKLEALGRMAGSVAHDFNNLLLVINANADLLAAALPADDPRREEVLAIAKAGQQASGLTRQLLAFGRRRPDGVTALDPNAVLTAAEPVLRRLVGKDIELRFDLGPDVAPVRAEASDIDQVILNLVMNARDAIEKKGQVVITTRNRRVDPADGLPIAAGECVSLLVTDDGRGMNDAVKERLFEPFFTTKGPDKGTGLGLSTVFAVVQKYRGHVRVESSPGEGARFEVLLPADRSPAISPPVRRDLEPRIC